MEEGAQQKAEVELHFSHLIIYTISSASQDMYIHVDVQFVFPVSIYRTTPPQDQLSEGHCRWSSTSGQRCIDGPY